MDSHECICACIPSECSELIELLKETRLYSGIVDTEEAFRNKLTHDPESILVYVHDGHIVGMVVVVFDPWASFIWHLAITPSCQKKGFGEKLLAAAESLITRRGGSVTCGYILDRNHPSRSLFRKCGYVEHLMSLSAVEKRL